MPAPRSIVPNIFEELGSPVGPVTLCFLGFGDDPASGARGDGPICNLALPAEGSQVFDWEYADWIAAAGGNLLYDNAKLGDWVSLAVVVPPTVATPVTPGTGNCVLVDSPRGPSTLIVPLATGTHTVDLDDVYVVPADYVEDECGPGQWNATRPDAGRGVASAAEANGGDFYLFTVEIEVARYVKIPILGSRHIALTIPAIQPRKLRAGWKLRLTAHRGPGVRVGDLELAWFLTLARVYTT